MRIGGHQEACTGPGPAPITSFRGEYDFLANPYLCAVWFEDKTYPSTEHAFHAAKSLDRAERDHISRLPDWRDAKRYGRQLQLRPGWDQIRRAVMLQLQLCKFTQYPDLAEALVATGPRVLVEGNWWGDTHWGAVPDGHPKWSEDLPWWHCGGKVWAGRNWLGIALMYTRDTLSPPGHQ